MILMFSVYAFNYQESSAAQRVNSLDDARLRLECLLFRTPAFRYSLGKVNLPIFFFQGAGGNKTKKPKNKELPTLITAPPVSPLLPPHSNVTSLSLPTPLPLQIFFFNYTNAYYTKTYTGTFVQLNMKKKNLLA